MTETNKMLGRPGSLSFFLVVNIQYLLILIVLAISMQEFTDINESLY